VEEAAARVAGFGSLSLLRCTGSGSWDRGLGRSIIGGSWGAIVDSCRGAWMFRVVDLKSNVDAEVRKSRESRLYLSMPEYDRRFPSYSSIATSCVEAPIGLELAWRSC